MLMAGYDGREVAEFWERISKLLKGISQLEILSTHLQMLQYLRTYLPLAKLYVAKYNAKVSEK